MNTIFIKENQLFDYFPFESSDVNNAWKCRVNNNLNRLEIINVFKIFTILLGIVLPGIMFLVGIVLYVNRQFFPHGMDGMILWMVIITCFGIGLLFLVLVPASIFHGIRCANEQWGTNRFSYSFTDGTITIADKYIYNKNDYSKLIFVSIFGYCVSSNHVSPSTQLVLLISTHNNEEWRKHILANESFGWQIKKSVKYLSEKIGCDFIERNSTISDCRKNQKNNDNDVILDTNIPFVFICSHCDGTVIHEHWNNSKVATVDLESQQGQVGEYADATFAEKGCLPYEFGIIR